MRETTKQDKQERILKAAVRVFARRGYHGSSIADIAEEAGVATGTIYLYFSKKEDLLTSLFQRNLGGYLEEARNIVLSQPRGRRQLEKLVELQLAFFDGDYEQARVFQIHMREVNPVIRDAVQPTLMSCFGLMEEVIENGIAAGAFDPGMDVRLARRILFGALDEVVTSWVLGENHQSLMAVAGPLQATLNRAFAPR